MGDERIQSSLMTRLFGDDADIDVKDLDTNQLNPFI